MTAYTVEITEITVVCVPAASDAADAERQALALIDAHATGAVRVSGKAIEADEHQRELADTEITEG